MDEPDRSLRALAERVDQAAEALAQADFAAFAEHAVRLDAEDLAALEMAEDPSANAEACRELRRSLESLGALLGHVAGVRDALLGTQPGAAGGYDRSGAAQQQGARREASLREEA